MSDDMHNFTISMERSEAILAIIGTILSVFTLLIMIASVLIQIQNIINNFMIISLISVGSVLLSSILFYKLYRKILSV